MLIQNRPMISSKPCGEVMRKIAAGIILSCICVAGLAGAAEPMQRDTVHFTLPPSPQVLAAHLFAEEPKPVRTRSISFKKPVKTVATTKSVSMPILFHFGKTTITPESKGFLNNIGEMLASPQHSERVLIVEGHTDAVGSLQFNQKLSELRALAIRDYLVNSYGVSPLRLFPVGKGENALYNTVKPNSRENRRVEFVPYSAG